MSAIFLATGAPPTGQAEGSLSPLAIAAASPSHPGYPQPPQLLPGSASLIATNCAVLGVAISNIDNGYNFAESLACSFGTSFGFLISIVILAGIREKSEHNNIPKPFQGTPIVLVSAGLMAIAFTGFTGVI